MRRCVPLLTEAISIWGDIAPTYEAGSHREEIQGFGGIRGVAAKRLRIRGSGVQIPQGAPSSKLSINQNIVTEGRLAATVPARRLCGVFVAQATAFAAAVFGPEADLPTVLQRRAEGRWSSEWVDVAALPLTPTPSHRAMDELDPLLATSLPGADSSSDARESGSGDHQFPGFGVRASGAWCHHDSSSTPLALRLGSACALPASGVRTVVVSFPGPESKQATGLTPKQIDSGPFSFDTPKSGGGPKESDPIAEAIGGPPPLFPNHRLKPVLLPEAMA